MPNVDDWEEANEIPTIRDLMRKAGDAHMLAGCVGALLRRTSSSRVVLAGGGRWERCFLRKRGNLVFEVNPEKIHVAREFQSEVEKYIQQTCCSRCVCCELVLGRVEAN